MCALCLVWTVQKRCSICCHRCICFVWIFRTKSIECDFIAWAQTKRRAVQWMQRDFDKTTRERKMRHFSSERARDNKQLLIYFVSVSIQTAPTKVESIFIVPFCSNKFPCGKLESSLWLVATFFLFSKFSVDIANENCAWQYCYVICDDCEASARLFFVREQQKLWINEKMAWISQNLLLLQYRWSYVPAAK